MPKTKPMIGYYVFITYLRAKYMIPMRTMAQTLGRRNREHAVVKIYILHGKHYNII